MMLLAGCDLCTSILVIPCDKSPLMFLNVRHVQEGQFPVLYGSFVDQCAFAHKCLCSLTPCLCVIPPAWGNVHDCTIVPLASTYEEQKLDMESAKRIYMKTGGSMKTVIEAIQTNYSKKLEEMNIQPCLPVIKCLT